MSATIQTKLVTVLRVLGCVQNLQKSGKMLAFEKPGQQGTYFYVGRMGALRKGPTKTKSIPIDKTKGAFLRIWDELERAEVVSNKGLINEVRATEIVRGLNLSDGWRLPPAVI